MPPDDRPDALRRVLGVGFGIAVGVGSMIGAGILRAPADVAARLPSPLLFVGVWVVGGLYALLGANALAELATMVPRSGGQYVFAQRAFGPYAGFVVGWNDWLSTSAAVGAIAIVFAEALAGLTGAGALGAPATTPVVSVPALAAAAVGVAALVLGRGVTAGDRTQRLTSALKAVVLIALVVACFALAPPHPPSPARATTAAGFVLALQGVIYAYDGWTGVMYFGEEVRDPGRQIPRAALGGVLAVMALYVAVNVAFLAVLPLDAMARSPLPAADVARALVGARGEFVVRALVVITLPSAIVANTLLGSRVAYALGRDGGAPASLARVSRSGVPTWGLTMTALAAMTFVATGTFERVINVCAFLFVASYVASFAAVFVLRRREPDAARPYRAWGHPWTTGLVLAGSLAFLAGVVAADPRGAATALTLVAVSPPMFWLLRRTGLVAR